ncbi:MAG TPA: sigma-54 dependent transcriptional regulator, partial [Opitutaceae bacterium]|nr:sigma-54 dependent transcriptional regulator [Opitutaceae bacterium]
MPDENAFDLIPRIKKLRPDLPIIVMSAQNTLMTALTAAEKGAFEYLPKPFDLNEVVAVVSRALSEPVRKPQSTQTDRETDELPLIGRSLPMQDIYRVLARLTQSDLTVMINGESGTGKELVARSIWKHSHRSSKPFIAVNCAAIPDNLIESELFGHEKGSFTGATAQRIGKFELCDGGTIFLDEIGDMALATQTKILRVLQQGEVQRVGGVDTIAVDVRILAATNKDLEEMVKAKTFREDLYYRLNVVRIRMPALRDRSEDIPPIVDFSLQNLVKQRKARVSKVSPQAMAVLVRYRWPGNVRELENVIYRSAVLAQGDTILLKHLPTEVRDAVGVVSPSPPPLAVSQTSGEAALKETLPSGPAAAVPVQAAADARTVVEPALTVSRALDFLQAELSRGPTPILERLEREMIERVLVSEGGNQLRAAEKLGITRATLRKRIDEWGLKV